MSTTFLFNGIDMTEYLDAAGIDMPAIPEIEAVVREVSGRDGTVYLGSSLKPLMITVKARLAADEIDPAEIQRRWAIVASMMRTDEPAPLSISPGIYRMAVLNGTTDLEFKTYSATADLKFYCADPVAYGERRTVSVPSGGSATFVVGGTYPASPVVKASGAVRDSTSHGWRVRLDGGDFLRVDTGTNQACPVVIDCLERTCRIGANASLPTLDSDWLVLKPGEHTIANDLGSGACEVEYVERWL